MKSNKPRNKTNKYNSNPKGKKAPSAAKIQHAESRRRRQNSAPVTNKSASENSQYIQWFPGHMTKTKRKIQADLKLVDAVAEVIDARVPLSSRNPDLPSMIGSKPTVILMNKCDLADPKSTKQWTQYFKERGIKAIELNCKTGSGINNFTAAVRDVLSDKIENWAKKGMINRPLRVMVVGIPNVGKSTFINRISKASKAKTEDRPGVTRGNQWFTLSSGGVTIDLLDTPGVLWPRFDDQQVGEKLAFTGAVKDNVTDSQQLALRLLEYFKVSPTQMFCERFGLTKEDISEKTSFELLEMIAKKRGMLISGGEADVERASIMLLDEFREAKLGRITLDKIGD
ncbi:MAG: ribosome biogenesis GTPase YlqF [Clostridia bacterium]|nr:ribosome biogenesis GTPase YlqF [Clostridia bacterium]